MSAEKLINTMEKLLQLHKSLYQLALKKTEIVKKGEMDALNQTLKDEQAHIAAINKFETERQKIASIIVPQTNHPSIEDCLNVVDGNHGQALKRLRQELLDAASQIKERNDLNQQMIYQSLQYVNFSLSLLIPKQENINYGPAVGQTKTAVQSPGLFNSKA